MEPKDVQVVVLMGGLGSRLGAVTVNQPKPLVSIHGKPFFEYELNLLLCCGFRKFLFLVGYRAKMIEQYFRDGSQYGDEVSIQYSYDGENLLGTGGAVVNALPLLEEEFLLIYGDSYMDVDYAEILYRYWTGKRNGKYGLMTVLKNEGRFDASNVRMSNGEIVSYKKGVNDSLYDYIDYGIEVFSKKVFAELPKGTRVDLADIQTHLVEKQAMATCEVFKRFYEIGSPSSLQEFREYTKQRFYTKRQAVFLDRDGVINEICCNEDTGQLDSPLHVDELTIMPQVGEAVKIFNGAGFYVFVVTNQPAAAKGKTTLGELYRINHMMVHRLEMLGSYIDDVVMCPHHPNGSGQAVERFLIHPCKCRKPETGLIDNIVGKYAIDMNHSWLVGDSYTDIQAGRKAGLRTAFIGDYKCDVCARLQYDKPDVIAANLFDAAMQVLSEGGNTSESCGVY